MKPLSPVVSRAGKKCKRCKGCSDRLKRDVWHTVKKFWKDPNVSTGLAASCADHLGKKRRNDKSRKLDRASRHRRKEIRDKKTPVIVNGSWRKSDAYTTLLTDDNKLAQQFLMRRWA